MTDCSESPTPYKYMRYCKNVTLKTNNVSQTVFIAKLESHVSMTCGSLSTYLLLAISKQILRQSTKRTRG